MILYGGSDLWLFFQLQKPVVVGTIHAFLILIDPELLFFLFFFSFVLWAD